MISIEQLQETVLVLIGTYGLVAVFLYMLLETSLLLHFVPSEVVVPFAAALLVTDPLSFATFVVVATAGATAGSVLAYYLFGKNSALILDRYGRYVHVSAADVDRWERWFHRWGESSVFWGRLLPLVRAVVSVPAGAAEMDVRRFVVYSAAGTFVFNFSLTYLVYTGERSGTVVGGVFEAVRNTVLLDVAYVRSHPAVVFVEILLILAIATFLWVNRQRIRDHPATAKRIALHLVRATGFLVGLLLISSALSVPDRAFASLTWIWNDPRVLTRAGLSPAQALLLLGCVTIVVTVLFYEIGRHVSPTRIYGRVTGR